MRKTSEFRISARVLLQVDIEGHSSWVSTAASQPAVGEARVDLAERLRRRLSRHGFELLSWKGDGGVYASRPETGSGNFDFAYNAATAVAKAFHEWRSRVADRATLRFRISLHYAGDVYIHAEHGYWASDDLNVFIKHEREIGVSGTVAVTDRVYRNLSPGVQGAFAASKTMHLGASPGHIAVKKVHYAPISNEAQMNRDDPHSFFEWLRAAGLPAVAFADDLVGPASFLRASIGDTTLLFAAPHPESPISVDMVSADSKGEVDLTTGEHAEWLSLQEKIREESKLEGKEDANKISASRIALPLSDIPLAQIFYRMETWSKARGFHMLLRERPELLRRLASQALTILEDGTSVPGITCCHMIVRTADVIGGVPTVLLCQRQRKGHADTYHAGLWSLSCEEQMRPGEEVLSCVKRGLAEELLGTQGTAGLTARIVGAVLERSLLNVSLIALVDVPMSFAEIVDSWQLAIDKDEHRQLTHLNVTRKIYREIAESGAIPSSIRAVLYPGHPGTFAETTDWAVHPTMLARLAFALWTQEVCM